MTIDYLEKTNVGDYPIVCSNKVCLPQGFTFHKSGGGNIHARGSQDMGKTLLLIHFVRELVKYWGYTPDDIVGNLTLTGELSGSHVLKGDDLRQYLWDCTHKPYQNKIVIIDEIDTEFPARFFQSREQTEIATRMWHNKKLRNWFLYSSHLGNGTDVIFQLAANFIVIPFGVNWEYDELEFTLINGLDLTITDEIAVNVTQTMSIYNRWEMTENTELDSAKPRHKQTNKTKSITDDVKRDGKEKIKRLLEAKQVARKLL